MDDEALAVKPIEDLLDLIIRSLGLDLAYRVLALNASNASSQLTFVRGADWIPSSLQLSVELSGPDAPLLTANNGELLHAIEHIAAKILNLEPEEHDRISLDADGFKQHRNASLRRSAEAAVAHVLETGQPFAFPPMTSRERRLLHLALQPSGLPTASSGVGAARFVVLYPHLAAASQVASPARANGIRNAFRPR